MAEWWKEEEVKNVGSKSPYYSEVAKTKRTPVKSTSKSTSKKTSTLDRAKLGRAEERLKGLPKDMSYQPSSPALELRESYSDRIVREVQSLADQISRIDQTVRDLTYEPSSPALEQRTTLARLASMPTAGFSGATRRPTDRSQPLWDLSKQVAYGKDYGVEQFFAQPKNRPQQIQPETIAELKIIDDMKKNLAQTKIWPENEYANYYDYRTDPSGGGKYGVWRDTGRHEGIDIYPTGVRGEDYSGSFDRTSVPVISTTSGTVLHSGTIPGAETAGITTMILGDDGKIHVYSHLNDTPFVQPGQRVSPYQELGYVGNTGRSSGAHLHYQIAVSPTGEPVVVDVEGFDPGSVYGRDYITEDPTEIVKRIYGIR